MPPWTGAVSTFGTVRVFDGHRVGPAGRRVCLDGGGLAAAGYGRDVRGHWRQAWPAGAAPWWAAGGVAV